MQKEKTTQARRAKAGKAGNTGSTGNTRTAGKTGKAGKTSKSKLTEAQRIAKRARDRKYREQARMAREMAETLRPGDAGSSCAGPAPSVQDVFSLIGRLVLQELAKEEGIPQPLSERSTIPAPIRMHLLRQRMAREISDIVDSHLELP